MNDHFISRYSPNQTDPEQLEAISVQRDEIFDETVEKVITSATTKSKHHMVFFGPRGAGKTHLVSIVNHRLSKKLDLKDKLLVAWLNEDGTSSSFLSLMLRIYKALSSKYPEEFPQIFLESIYDHEDALIAFETLAANLKTQVGERTVLVIVENMDAIFRNLDQDEQKKWRAFIQNNPQVFCTLGTAQQLSKDFASQDFPFFGFFNVKHLKPFDVDEARELLINIALINGDLDLQKFLETPKGRSRVRALHHLTGGNQRLFIILSDFTDRDSLDSLVRPFKELADEQLTPYYQERLRWISTQQRMIVEYLCKETKPVPVKSIARHLFIPHSTITGQLKHLRGMGYVIANKRGKESLYELAEPLMRLSFQIKDAKDSSSLRMIVDFLRIWYEKIELQAILKQSAQAGGTIDKYLTEAIRLADEDDGDRESIIRESPIKVGESKSSYQVDCFEGCFEEIGSLKNGIDYLCSLITSGKKNIVFKTLSKPPYSGLPKETKHKVILYLCLFDYCDSEPTLDDRYLSFLDEIDDRSFKAAFYITAANCFAWCSRIPDAVTALQKGFQLSDGSPVDQVCDLPTFFFAYWRNYGREGLNEFGEILEILRENDVLEEASVSFLSVGFVKEIINDTSGSILEVIDQYATRYRELSLAVRLVKVVVRFLCSDRDSKILLDLPIEERKIAQEFLDFF